MKLASVGVLSFVVACSPVPAEPLPVPHPTGKRCKAAAVLADHEYKVAVANQARLDEALARFLTTNALTASPTRLVEVSSGSYNDNRSDTPEVPNFDAAQRIIGTAWYAGHRPRDDQQRELLVDLGRTTWSQVVVVPYSASVEGDSCGPSPREPTPVPGLTTATFHLAYDASGAPEVVVVHAHHRIAERLDQCGSCTVGCGIPFNPPQWIAWVLPIGTGVHVPLDSVDVPVDDVEVRCEHETWAM